MGQKTKTKVSEWLAQRHSHTAYDVEFVREGIEPSGVLVGMTAKGVVTFHHPDDTTRCGYAQSIKGKDFKKAADNPKNPKGPIHAGFSHEEAKGLHLLGGWQIAAALADVLVGKTSDSLGRGTAFWENIDILREAGY